MFFLVVVLLMLSPALYSSCLGFKKMLFTCPYSSWLRDVERQSKASVLRVLGKELTYAKWLCLPGAWQNKVIL